MERASEAKGMMAWSLAGHDRGKLYVIIREEGDFVWLCDGRLRPLENPKKKRRKHTQIMKRIPAELGAVAPEKWKNEEIKHCICVVKKELAGGSYV